MRGRVACYAWFSCSKVGRFLFILQLPFFYVINTIKELTNEELGHTNPLSSNSFSCRFTSLN